MLRQVSTAVQTMTDMKNNTKARVPVMNTRDGFFILNIPLLSLSFNVVLISADLTTQRLDILFCVVLFSRFVTLDKVYLHIALTNSVY